MGKINYYEVLNIDRALSTEEIKDSLLRLEATWQQRVIQMPEKAQEMLKYLAEAKAIFANDNSRNDYDTDLDGKSIQSPDNDNKAKESEFKEYCERIKEYLDSKQYDLAKMALDQALALEEYDSDKTHFYLYYDATEVYLNNGMYEEALSISNRNVFLNPNESLAYYKKIWALYNYIMFVFRDYGIDNADKRKYVDMLMGTCETWQKKSDDYRDVSSSWAYMSVAYDFQGDYANALICAQNSISYNEKNGMAQKMIERICNTYKADLSEVSSYFREPLCFYEEIQSLVGDLMSLEPTESYGYPLLTKKYKYDNSYSDDTNSKQINEKTITYAISREGKFVSHIAEQNTDIPYDSGMIRVNLMKKTNSRNVVEMNIDDFAAEFDFIGSAIRSFSRGRDEFFGIESSVEIKAEQLHEIQYLANQLANMGHFQIYEFNRRGLVRGFGLYKTLKDIIEREANYIAACREANEKFDAEIAPVRAQIAQRYEQKRKDLASEMQLKTKEAEKDDRLILDLQAELSAMDKEFSSLGFFLEKEKKNCKHKWRQ